MTPAPHSRETLIWAYDRMRGHFYRVLQQQTRDCHISFTSPFARLEFLCKQHGYVGTAGYRRINDFRGRLNRLRHSQQPLYLSDNLLLDDAQALTHFLAHIGGCDIPQELIDVMGGNPAELDGPDQPTALQEEEASATTSLGDALRVVVQTWEAIQRLIVVRDEGGEERQVLALPNAFGDFDSLFPLLRANATLSLVRPVLDAQGYIHADLIVFEPDLLVDISSIAHCIQPQAVSPRNYLLDLLTPSQMSPAILLGHLASQMLDEEITASGAGTHTYEETITRFFAQQAIPLATCTEMQEPEQRVQFHEEARQQQQNIRRMVRKAFVEDHQIHLDHILLEPSFVSPMLGIQGRMDLLQDDLRVLMEQKSGKLKFPDNSIRDEHYAQMLLYLCYLHYNRGMRNEQVSSYLLYSKYPDGLLQATTVPSRIGQAFRLRNGIVWLQQALAEGGVRVLDQWTPESLNENHIDGPLWSSYIRPRLAELLDTVHRATPIERAYFYRMVTFAAREHLLSKAGNSEQECSGFASLWNASLAEKLQSGNIMHRLQILEYQESRAGMGYDRLLLDCAVDESGDMLPNFRVGDIVVFYQYSETEEPDVRQVMIFRASIEAMTPETLTLHLRSPQRNVSVFATAPRCAWAIEHDLMESSHTALYRACYALLNAPQERRDLLLGQRTPTVDTTVQRIGDYGGAYFDDLVLHAMQARDFYIVMGPPGTGKTSYGLVNILKETQLRQPDADILLMSYTNRAVDEICGKLIGLGAPFIRMGGALQCPEAYRPYLLDEVIRQCHGAGEVRRHIAEARIIVGTTTALTARLGIMRIKPFDLAIIDEASQILEPHLLALLSARWVDGTSAIRKFIMIGDHKQLPAVVQQTAADSQVTEQLLRDIGLTDCRHSLFERLHTLYGGRPETEYLLSRQGRMHPEVADFASQTFYAGCLVPIPLEHQLLPSQQPRVVFLDSSLNPQPSTLNPHPSSLTPHPSSLTPHPSPLTPHPSTLTLPDKVNPYEAELTAELVHAYYQQHTEEFDPLQSVGVIVPYRNQIAMVRKALAKYQLPVLLDITIDTVERYQGSQRDYIIYSFTVRRPYQLDFLASSRIEEGGEIIDRKLNVALTRARLQMTLIGQVPLLRRDPIFSRLIDRYFVQ